MKRLSRLSLLVLVFACLNVTTLLSEEAVKVETVTFDAKGVKLQVPKSWQAQKPSSSMRLAQFSIPAEKAKADLVLFWFNGGSAGGVDANVRRWVGQFQEQGRQIEYLSGECKPGGVASSYVWLAIHGTWKKPDGPPFARKTIDAPNSTVINMILMVGKENPKHIFFKMSGLTDLVKSQAAALKASITADLKSEKTRKIK